MWEQFRTVSARVELFESLLNQELANEWEEPSVASMLSLPQMVWVLVIQYLAIDYSNEFLFVF